MSRINAGCAPVTFFKSLLSTSFIFCLVFSCDQTTGLQCQKTGLVCIDTQHFQECSNVDGQFYLVGDIIACPSNQFCDDSSGSIECSSVAPTTTELSVAVPQCTEAGKHPAPNCNQYYECIYVSWWWDSQLKTCPDNYYFDVWLKDCTLASLVDCQSRTPTPVITTVAPTVPTCTGPGRHPSIYCYDYYECEENVDHWEAVIKTCVIGQAFDLVLIACANITIVDCGSRLTTRQPSTTTTLTPSTSGVSNCSAPGKFPAYSCYDYYECEPVSWWWQLNLKTCAIGQAFDVVLIDCAPVASVDCGSRTTTTVVPTTSTVASICSGPGKYPALSCYEYYNCVQVSSYWVPVIETCVVGQAFDIVLLTCAPVLSVDCGYRLTTTTTTTLAPTPTTGPACSGPGKYPALYCHEYYDCEQRVDQWEAVLKVCVIGEAFDMFLLACASVTVVDCQSRLTTTRISTTSTTSTTTLAPTSTAPSLCSGPGKFASLNCFEYYECEQISGWWEPVLKSCIIGEAFDVVLITCAPIDLVDCGSRLTTPGSISSTSTTTLTPIPTAAPLCSGPGKFVASSCYEYYECEQISWWWEPVLKSCIIGEAFDVFLIACAPIDSVDCGSRLTTSFSETSSTTTLAPIPIVPPACTGPGKYPALYCHEYYDCEQKTDKWEAVLKVCVIGEAFDTILLACASVTVVDCQSRLITTTTITSSTTTIAPTSTAAPLCSGPGKFVASSCYEYYECEQISWWWEPVLKSCVIGEAFDVILIACAPIASVDCGSRLTTPTVTTSTSPTTLTPISTAASLCSGPGKFLATSCYEYYECEQISWWWEPVLKSCVIGEAFDVILIDCAPIATVDCGSRSTTPSSSTITSSSTTTSSISTTTEEPVSTAAPLCSGPGKFAAPSCYEYYECEQLSWWWEPTLKSCLIGEAFDLVLIACAPVASVDCGSRITTTTTPTTTISTTTEEPLPTVPSCSGPSKYPAPNCFEYYECEQFLWWWQPNLKACVVGEAFDVVLVACASVSTVDCGSRLTTLPSTTTTITSSTTTAPICNGPGRHPSNSCYEYYECEENAGSWEAILKVCVIGQAFDTVLIACASFETVDCGSRLTTRTTELSTTTSSALTTSEVPVCTGPGRHPSKSCYEYYECEESSGFWEAKLKVCIVGQAFDTVLIACASFETVDCGSRLTTTTTPTTTILTTTEEPLPTVPSCSGPSKYPAPNCFEYYECEQFLWWWQPNLKACVVGEAFDVVLVACASVSTVDCGSRLTTLPSTTTTITPSTTTAPICTGPGRHPSKSCYEYYECEESSGFWEAKLKVCIVGQAFDTVLIACASFETVDCGSRLTIRTTELISTTSSALTTSDVPVCTGPGRHPSKSCYEYYECEESSGFWEAKLKVCIVGQAFDTVLIACASFETVDCGSRLTTRTTELISTTSSALTTSDVPVCTGPGRHPSKSCYEYYECEESSGFWEAKLKVCIVGQAFDTVLIACASFETVDCGSRLTTRTTELISTTSSALTTSEVPVCTGPGRHPSKSCYEYYECEESSGFWEAKLKVCIVGQAFDTVLIACASFETVDCGSRLTTRTTELISTTSSALTTSEVPVCTGPGRHPSKSCYEYYECEESSGFWEAKLKVCIVGQAFDTVLIACASFETVDCGSRLTTRTTELISTTSSALTTSDVPVCTGPGRHPSKSCYEYYECEESSGFWEAKLKVCIVGQAFDTVLIACASFETVDCGSRLTTRTTELSTTTSSALTTSEVPVCTGPGRHPSKSCYEYYECEESSGFWEAKLKVCIVGQAFDTVLIACAAFETVDCGSRLTTRTTELSTTTSSALTTSEVPVCTGPGRHPSKSCYEYYECEESSGFWEAKLKVCIVGQAFDTVLIACAAFETVDCGSRLTTRTTELSTTTSSALTTSEVPVCTGPGRHPSKSCYEYYECEESSGFWEAKLKVCIVGQAFDTVLIACASFESVDCGSRLTTRTTELISTTSSALTTSEVPVCTGPGRHPSKSCYEYYECEESLGFWEAKLKVCIVGQAFDTVLIACAAFETVDCGSRLTTRTTELISTTSSALTTSEVPVCTGPGRHPSKSCYEYYECEESSGFWEAKLKVCIVGQAFDTVLIACASFETVDCGSRLTTRTTELISTTSSALTTSDVPVCTGPGRHPSKSCYEYYECEESSGFWEAKLKVCIVGQAFDTVLIACASFETVDCGSRLTTRTTELSTTTSSALTTSEVPVCTGPGRHPSKSCYEYYECEESSGFWEAKLKVCIVGQAFDTVLIACAAFETVDCGSRLTTRTTELSTTTSSALTTSEVPVCTGPGRHPSKSCYEYYECEESSGFWEAKLKVCIVGQAFDTVLIACASFESVDCGSRLTTRTTELISTTSSALTTSEVPVCTGPGRHPSKSCYEYYECEESLGFWEAKLKVCIVGQAFDTVLIACAAFETVDCGSRLTTRTTELISTTSSALTTSEVPVCTGPGRHPSKSCYEYYECEESSGFWEAKLKVCIVGQAFDTVLIACASFETVDCGSRLTTRTTELISTTSSALTTSDVPVCTGPGRHPSKSCYEYYECEESSGFWEAKLKVCIVGQAFDTVLIACASFETVDCGSRLTTRTTELSTTTSSALTTSEVPVCTGPGRHPSKSCYEYYECEESSGFWEAKLKVCIVGQAFDTVLIACAAFETVDCGSRLTTRTTELSTTTSSALTTSEVPVCTGPGRHPSKSCYEYYECEESSGFWEAKLKVCIVGQAFDTVLIACAAFETVDCGSRLTTRTTELSTTTSSALTTSEVPVCTGPGRHPSKSCYEYYECEESSGFWEAKLKVCIVGQAFDTVLIACASFESVDCGSRLTTRTTELISTTSSALTTSEVPVCTGPGRHPSKSCYEYYECEESLGFWEAKLKVCIVGQAFDTVLIACAAFETVDCGSRLTTRTTELISTTSSALTTSEVPVCTGPGRHPSKSCYEYYECEESSGFWEAKLKVCIVGQAFDTVLIACASFESVDCGSRLTTRTTELISTTSSALTTSEVPVCTGPGRHPSKSCYEYYECEESSGFWEAKLKVCIVGQAFDTVLIACASFETVDCGSRLTTRTTELSTTTSSALTTSEVPVCTGPGRHPSKSCYEYYECEESSGFWEAKLKVCIVGQAFDTVLIACAAFESVDCGSRLTTRTTELSTTTSSALTTSEVPVCTGPGRHPSKSCYEYYECEESSGFWEAKLKVCIVGQAFDTVLIACASFESVDCGSRLTTRTTELISTTSSALTTSEVPVCTGPGRHPSKSCYEYYECEESSGFWEAKLKVCIVGQAFDTVLIACASFETVDCGSRLTTTTIAPSTTTTLVPIEVPTCSSSSNHTAPACNQYYECVPVLWWWNVELKTCPCGQNFDSLSNLCNDKDLVDCQERSKN